MNEIICIDDSSDIDVQLLEVKDNILTIMNQLETKKEDEPIGNFSEEELSDLDCFIPLSQLIQMGGNFKERAEIIMSQFSSEAMSTKTGGNKKTRNI